jgi:hypothetical protein
MAKRNFIGGYDNGNSIDFWFRTKQAAEKERKRLKTKAAGNWKGRKMVITTRKWMLTKLHSKGKPIYYYQLRIYD